MREKGQLNGKIKSTEQNTGGVEQKKERTSWIDSAVWN